ncbi:hypothetical protein V8G54_031698 [Vigna mungo]|uniref:Protein kinase domain-containing protein n=1 Tax=Vigna mungo TaxID=3915 RepID=A0AAQ3MKM7_VIGMU
MILKLVIHFIIFVTWFIHTEVSAQDDLQVVAKPGCDSQCGDLEIPFPFGMNASECYAGKWFEIECRNTSTYQTPYLKSIGLQVTSIDVQQGMVTINNPIYRNNCGTKDSTPVNRSLEGSPFVYSQHNKFVAAGCNIIALLKINGSEGSGCVSICDEDLKVDDIGKMELKNSNCNGKSCCENSLPAYLKEYSTEVKGLKENETDGECSYAMVVQQEELNPYEWDYVPEYSSYTPKGYYFPVNGEMKDLDMVPVVLEWEILNNLNLKLPPDDLSHCFDTNITSSLHKRSGQRCSCPGGFGNPYVDGGCSDYEDYRNSPSHVPISVIKVNMNKVKLFSLKELEKATDNFNTNRVLGKGGQATVYKGMLIDGTIIAVKKFKVQGKIEEFINEFVILSQINHRNVVKLLGSCLETKIPLLVYEFIPNGNLFEYLHLRNEDMPLTWNMRLRIAIEVAGALFYLHSAASQPIYHKDIKSTNILLDEKYRAKVADFGTSRMISIDVTHLTTVVQGTFGYLDPEFFQTSQFTEKSDVYSFGVVLVELLTGQKPITLLSQEEAKSLASYFIMCVEENCVFDIIDERVMKEGEKCYIMKVINLASRCLELNGKRRPTMREITLELEAIRKLENESNAQEGKDEFVRSEDYKSWDDNSINSEIMSTIDLSSRMTILKDVDIVTICSEDLSEKLGYEVTKAKVSARHYLQVAKPGCDSQCGDHEIPFPFGMNASECYAGAWFEIECKNTSTYQTPYLKLIGVQVTLIDVQQGTVTINNPIYRHNCGTKYSRPVYQSLEGSPYVYSQEHNKFVAVGCNIITFFQVKWSESSSCASICDEDFKVDDIRKMNLGNSDCNGKSCCQNSLPAYLQEYITEVKGLKENETDHECSYAMVVKEKLNHYEGEDVPHSPYYYYKGYFPVNGEMKDLDVVPVVLEWEIPNNLNLKLPPDYLSHCFDTNITSSLGSGKRCSCIYYYGFVNVDKVRLFSLKELEQATDNFNTNRVLGKGGQATVYKGMLIDGTIIVVKKFKVQGKIEEFINEFVILSQINHRNVVKLLGSCLETKIPLLVYEFIPNGNLFEYLHQQNEDMPLTWEMHLRIAIEVSGALFYLHSAASQPIYHKDIKSTNILLDEKYRAKVADFGTSRMISIDVTHLTTVVQGTFGYLDPEFFQTSQFTEKSDVYSFGVVLVELLTGQKPITLLSQEEAKSLASYFIMCVEENSVFNIIDERVMKEGEKCHIMKVVNLASQCLELNGKRRPTMREITLELEDIRKLKKESNAQEGHDDFVRSEDYQSLDDNSFISEIMSTFDLSSRTTILKDVHIVTM